MARKIDKSEAAPAPDAGAAEAATEAAKAAKAAEQMQVLHPDQGLTLAGRTVLVREYRGIEGLNLQAGIGDFLAALYAVFAAPREQPPAAVEIREVFMHHAVTVQWMLAQSITPYPEDPALLQAFAEETAQNAKWVGGLDDLQLDALMSVWWGANSRFFTRRFRERRLADAAKPSEKPGSTPH